LHFRCEKDNKTPLEAAQFYVSAGKIHRVYSCCCKGRIFANTAIQERQMLYFTAEEFVMEAIAAFQESIQVIVEYNRNSCFVDL